MMANQTNGESMPCPCVDDGPCTKHLGPTYFACFGRGNQWSWGVLLLMGWVLTGSLDAWAATQGLKEKSIASQGKTKKKSSSAKPAASKSSAPANPIPSPPVAQGTPSKSLVLLMPLGHLGLREDLVASLQRLLQQTLQTMPNRQVIPAIELEMLFEDPQFVQQGECDGSLQCARRAGKALGAQYVVYGALAGLGQSFALNLRLAEVGTGKELQRIKKTLSGGQDMLIPEIRLAAYQLLAPQSIVGSLSIQCPIQGAEIHVDEQLVGLSPLAEPIKGLTVGEHRLLIRRVGFQDMASSVKIRPFETTFYTLVLDPAQSASATSLSSSPTSPPSP